MTNSRTTAIVVGALFIIATAASVASAVVTAPILGADDRLAAVATQAGTATFGVLFMFIAAASIAGIPVALFPLFRKHSEAAALAFLVARVFEAMLFLIGGVAMLTFVVLGADYAASSAQDAGYYATLSSVILGAQDIAFNTGTVTIFSVSAIILGIVLYQTELVPRWLAGWMAIGGVLLLVEGVLVMFGASNSTLDATLFIPIALAEMVFAVWLIVKGFDAAALGRLSAKGENP